VTRQFYCKNILWQNRPLHFLWQNWHVGRGGGETHAIFYIRLWRSSGLTQKADQARPGTPGLLNFHRSGSPWGVSGWVESVIEGRPGPSGHSRTPRFPLTGPTVGGARSGPSQKANQARPDTPHGCDGAQHKRVVCVWWGWRWRWRGRKSHKCVV